jgi:alkylation response protein AidB-like acyl-CoA dehydrogenase
MNFSPTEEQQATGELATQILTDLASHERLREIERSGETRFDPACWSELAKAGLLSITIPEAHGGAGLGLLELEGLLRAVGRTGAAVPVWESVALGALPIAQFGSDAVQSRWLPGIADGSVIATAAWQEDDRRSDVINTTLNGSGDSATVTGHKICVPAGQLAHVVVVPTSGGLALVEIGEGVEVTPLVTTAGSPDAALTFTNAPAVVLSEDPAAVQWAYERAVATQCAVALGNTEAMLTLLGDYTKERKQFDQPIAMFQAVGHRAADAYIDTEGQRLTCWQALSRLAEGLDATAEVSIAKYWAAFGGHRVALAAAHLHGGVGADRDYPLARHFTKEKELELYLGGGTEHLLRIGKVLAAS